MSLFKKILLSYVFQSEHHTFENIRAFFKFMPRWGSIILHFCQLLSSLACNMLLTTFIRSLHLCKLRNSGPYHLISSGDFFKKNCFLILELKHMLLMKIKKRFVLHFAIKGFPYSVCCFHFHFLISRYCFLKKCYF